MLEVIPKISGYDVLLTAVSPLSHHDPVTDKSNRSLFNRRKQLVQIPPPGLPEQARVDAICEAYQPPEDLAPIMAELDFSQFASVCLVKEFLDLYNRAEGIGVHTGDTRYTALADRVGQAGTMAFTVLQFWSVLGRLMGVQLHAGEHDGRLLNLLAIPAAFGGVTMTTLATQAQAITAIARAWHRAEREADKAAQMLMRQRASFAADALVVRRGSSYVVEVPAISANGLRHQLLRGPLYQHLTRRLGLRQGKPGEGDLPPGVEALLYNGGSIDGGAKAPSDAFALTWDVRAAYPSLDLLGGCLDGFDLGESRVKVHGWLVCRENREALVGTEAYDCDEAEVSIFEMLDDVTHTRQAGRTGDGQMLWSFESLAAGAKVLVRLSLDHQTPDLTHGALVTGIEEYLDVPLVGGQSARGCGLMRGQWLAEPRHDLAELYEEYLEAHGEELRAWLVDGTLGTGKVVCT